MRGELKQSGDIEFFINAVLGSVLFTLLFLTGDTMMQSVVRIPEWAVLKTYGYGDVLVTVLMFVGGLALCLLAAILGLAIVAIAHPVVFSTIGVGTSVVIKLEVSIALLGTGIAWACVVGLIGGLFPAIRAARLPIAAALREL